MNQKRIVLIIILLTCLIAAGLPSRGQAGMLRIKFRDGTSVDVDYCWEEKGQIRFEVPGGVAGVARSQVSAIDEIITSRPFTPDIMGQREEIYLNVDEKDAEWFKDFMINETPHNPDYQVLTPDEVNDLMAKQSELKITPPRKSIRIFASSLERQGEISEWIRLRNNGTLLLISHTVSTYDDMSGKAVYLSLYDGDGKRVKKILCQIHALDVDRKKMKELGISGRLYALVAKVRPDPRVRRYEISTARL